MMPALALVPASPSVALVPTVTGDLFGEMRFGFGWDYEAPISATREQHGVNLQISATWLNSRAEMDAQLSREWIEGVWAKGYIPVAVTWGWMEHSYRMEEPVPTPTPVAGQISDQTENGAGYQAYQWAGYTMANLKRFRNAWLDDCRRMARRVKAPNDGKHLVLFCLETEFNCYPGLGSEGRDAWVYWGQWMRDTRRVIKEIAPNALVSFSFGGWEAWGDPTRDGALTRALQDMDFISFQSMWPCVAQEDWIRDPAATDAREKRRYSGAFGEKPHVWDYHIDEILMLAEKLHKYNSHLFISHYMHCFHLWGYPNTYNNYALAQSSVDDATALFNDEAMDRLRQLGVFGLNTMEVQDWNEFKTLDRYPYDQWAVWGGDPWHNTGGTLLFPDGAHKPAYQLWIDGVNRYTTVGSPPATASVSDDHLWLHVSGKTIRTSPAAAHPNAVFVPVGVCYSPGVMHDYDYQTYLKGFKAQGLNCFRLTIFLMTADGHKPHPSDGEFLEQLYNFWDPVIQYAKTVGLYVVIDDHEFLCPPPVAPDPNADVVWTPEAIVTWQRRWGLVARRYANEPIVLGYELMNEPHNWGDDMDGFRSAILGAITEIREHDKRHLLIVPSEEWNHSRAMERSWGEYLRTKGNPDPQRNAVFAFHEYPHDNDPPVVHANITAFRDRYGVPVMCTEYGTTYEAGNDRVPVEENRAFQKGLLEVCESLGVGWLTWTAGGPQWPYEDVWGPVARRTASPLPTPNRGTENHR